jgi:hypothetical protein
MVLHEFLYGLEKALLKANSSGMSRSWMKSEMGDTAMYTLNVTFGLVRGGHEFKEICDLSL